MNSSMIDLSDAPSALRKPISRLRSVTTAVIVVATHIMISASVMMVTSRTSAESFESTVV